jgi:hypothetical protein
MNEETIKQLTERITKLEQSQIQNQMIPESKEQLKNALFENVFQSDKTIPAVDADTPYLKVIWKNKILYIPIYQ